MKEVLVIGSYVVGIGELFLSIYLWSTKSSSNVRKVVSFLALATSAWVISSAFVAYRVEMPVTTFFSNATYAAGVFLMTSLLHFVVIYPTPLFSMDRIHVGLLYIPALIFSTISMTSNAIEGHWIASQANVGQVIGGPVLPVYNFFLLALFILSIVVLFYRLPRLDGINRSNITLVLVSILIAGLPAVVLDLILTTFSIPSNYLYGNIASGVWLGSMAYILVKK